MNNNLKYKNKFNTYQRFTDQNGLQQYKNGICIDHINGEELSELQAKEIEAIVAYNKGEWSYSGPHLNTPEFLDWNIPMSHINYSDWYKPNANPFYKDLGDPNVTPV